jgi:hypothetical protein
LIIELYEKETYVAAVLLETLIREHAKEEQTRKCRAQFEDEEKMRKE